MAQIHSMERGTLSEEYRVHPDGSGGTVRRGPYFKHQVWEAGGNRSRRVPPAEVPQLREDLASHQRFTELAQEYVELTVAQTRRRRAQDNPGADPEAKKNSRRKSKAKGSAKPKPSSS
jgi:mannitol-1-phosphate/altronate dehydrogenase